ncbi:uncharacterized protein C8Q71DRAFT_672784, partial [Rhodofomes roseus]
DDSSSIPSEGGTSLAEPGGDNLVAQIIANQASNIRHAAIKVARHKNPFESQEDEDAFWVTLDSVTDTGFVPRHMNIREEEWEQDGYPTHENLVVGKRKPPLRVELPHELWLPRAEAWCRAVWVLTQIL